MNKLSEDSKEPAEGNRVGRFVFVFLALICLTPWVSAPLALLMGLVVAQVLGNPFMAFIQKNKLIQRLLQYSVVGLGFGMNIQSAVQAGKQGVLFTVVTIAGTLILGAILGIVLKMDRKTTHLVSCGTAICGGSAIAAVAPVIKADSKQISVSLGIVFILNAIALFIFPFIGHYFDLTETQFGLWSAIAIHDTSSVVGAASKYGDHALQVATTVKLARALWIIPLAFFTALFFRQREHKIKIPWFIAFFILAMLVNTYVPVVHAQSRVFVSIAKAGLVLTLFLIGAGLSLNVIRSVGIKPLVLGVLLWIAIASSSLFFVMYSVK